MKTSTSLLSILALPLLVISSPSAPKLQPRQSCPYQQPVTKVAKYDDLYVPPFNPDPVPDVYESLSYPNFYATDQFDYSVVPASPNNTVANRNLLFPRVVKIPDGERYRFTPRSVYVACTNGYLNSPCTMTIVGLRATSPCTRKRVAIKKDLVYPAQPDYDFNMIKVDFPEKEWEGLTELEFRNVTVTETGYTPGVALDNFEYVLRC